MGWRWPRAPLRPHERVTRELTTNIELPAAPHEVVIDLSQGSSFYIFSFSIVASPLLLQLPREKGR